MIENTCRQCKKTFTSNKKRFLCDACKKKNEKTITGAVMGIGASVVAVYNVAKKIKK